MKIETKYNIGDEVLACDTDKRICNGKIEKVRIYVFDDGVFIDYLVRLTDNWNCWIAEQVLFSTKEEFLKSLQDENN